MMSFLFDLGFTLLLVCLGCLWYSYHNYKIMREGDKLYSKLRNARILQHMYLGTSREQEMTEKYRKAEWEYRNFIIKQNV